MNGKENSTGSYGSFAGLRADDPEPIALFVWYVCLFSVACFPALVGCGRDNPSYRQAVYGKVILDGAPLDQGTIFFASEEPQGISSGGVIRDGAYTVPPTKGLPPGKYVVRINSSKSNPAEKGHQKNPYPSPGGSLPGIECIAPKYNVDSTIVIEIAKDRPTTFDFNVESQHRSTSRKGRPCVVNNELRGQ